jgi:hypothetical protein
MAACGGAEGAGEDRPNLLLAGGAEGCETSEGGGGGGI